MAKYEDYVKRRDGGTSQDLEKEIADAQAQTKARKQEASPDGFDLPERFVGKGPEEIAQSYVELERKFSQQGNDLGQMRRTVDQLIALQSQPKEPEREPITADDLYLDPEDAIRRTATDALSPQLTSLERELLEMKQRFVEQDLTSKFPDWRKTTSEAKFQSWVQEKPYRARLAVAAAQNDTEAAEELLSMYHDMTTVAESSAEQKRRQALIDAGLARGGPSIQDDGEIEMFSRVELLEKRIAASRGDNVAERWLKANDARIRKAYQENRVVD
jgi:hypothetical protein